MRYAILLAVLTSAIVAERSRRTDDLNNVEALKTLLHKQAATIQALEARVSAQDVKLLQQTVDIHNLQAELATQQNTIGHLLANFGAQQNTLDHLEANSGTQQNTGNLASNSGTQHNSTGNLAANSGPQHNSTGNLAANSGTQQNSTGNLAATSGTPQQNSTGNLAANSGSQLDHSVQGNQTLASRLDAVEKTQAQQAASLQGQETSLRQLTSVQQEHEVTLHSVLSQLQSLGGRVASQEQAVGFYADFGQQPYHEVPLDNVTAVQFTRVLTNVGDGYDNITGIFTTPVSGLYAFQLHFTGADHEGSTDLAVMAAGRTVSVAYAEGSKLDSGDQGSGTAVVQLARGQEVSVRLSAGVPKIWGSVLTSFSGMLVHSH